jgi:ubiquinone/menaquinone biosynthesis C-methylase UbiE
MKTFTFVVFAFCLIFNPSSVFAQQESVRPGINDKFNNATDEVVSSFVERFEKEGREIFDQRQGIVNACQLRPAMVVADIGAGTGLFTRLMAPSVAEVYAVDISQKFLDHVKEKCDEDGLKNVKTVLCDQTTCGLEPNSVDVVFICDTYHHFEFPYKTMRSIRKALKPDGVVVLVEFDRVEGESSEWILNHVRADRKTFSNEIELAGFEEVEMIDDIFKTSYLKRYKKAERKSEKGHTTDSLADVRKGLDDGTAVLIDVREQSEWDAGHLVDATLVPRSELLKIATDRKKVSGKVPSDKIVYTHCKRGGRAAMVAKELQEHGFDIRPLPQGFEQLVTEGFEKAK